MPRAKKIPVNPAIIIGPRDLNKISGSIVIEAARGLVRFYLPGGANYVSVEDVVAGHIAAAERGRPGERYILGGENLSHRQVIDTIVEVTGAPRPLFSLPRWAIEPTALAVAAARKVLGILDRLNRMQHLTIILITHNAALGAVARRLVRLVSGRVAESRVNENPIRAEEVAW